MQPVVEVCDNVFTFLGVSRFGPLVSIGKTMTVLRHGTELTLVNSCRLNDDDEQALRALGTVKHLVRLGCSHGLDDPWVLDRFAPRYWAPGNVRLRDGRKPDEILDEGRALPFAGSCVVFKNVRESEAVVVVDDARLLLTCDALQAWTTTAGSSVLGALTLRGLGFLSHPIVTGGVWVKKNGLPGIIDDYRRVAGLDFSRFLAGHGGLVDVDAAAHVNAAVARLARKEGLRPQPPG